MNSDTAYFVFNKERDFTRGFLQNAAYTSRGVEIAEVAGAARAVFVSRLLDSGEKKTVWHRMLVESESVGDASIRFTFYASEERTCEIDGQKHDLEELIAQSGASEVERVLSGFMLKTAINPKDMLLHDVSARYLWFKVELLSQGGQSPSIKKIKIFLPKKTWLDYLPEVYQKDAASKSFVERYLSIFSSVMSDMERNIDDISSYFDADTVEGDFLYWLAGWLNIEDAYIWPPEKLRYLLKNGVRMYKMRGTRSSLSEIVELYTGEKPYIVERYQLEKYIYDAKKLSLMSNLYGYSSYIITVVENERCISTSKEYKTLLRIIESVKPAHVEVNLVVLKPYIFLDKYSYLGMNSVLGKYRAARMDGFSAVPFTNISEEP